MATDPLVKAFIDKISASHTIKFWELPLPAARIAFGTLAGLAGPKNVPIGKIEKLDMPGPGGRIRLRVFTPVAAGGGGLPALVFFHGGGFVFGNLDIYDGICRMLANGAGARVVSVDYRLAPEHKFPAAPDDAFAALKWVSDNAARLGIDAGCIAVGGDSAGGNFTAAVCQRAKKEGGPHIAAQLLIAPMTHLMGDYPSRRAFETDPILSTSAARWFMEQYLPRDVDPDDVRVSPLLTQDVGGLPPAYFLLGGDDPLHDEGLAYAERLRAAGVRVTVADYPGMMHDFTFLQSVLPQAHEALTAAAKAMGEMMRK
jgi:acetyl esterase